MDHSGAATDQQMVVSCFLLFLRCKLCDTYLQQKKKQHITNIMKTKKQITENDAKQDSKNIFDHEFCDHSMISSI